MKTHFYTLVIAAALFGQGAQAQCWQPGNGMSGGVSCLVTDTLHHCLYLGGGFEASGNDSLHYCCAWNDTTFFPMGSMMNNGANDSVWCFALFNGDLFAGGSFTQAGGNPANHIARWDGSAWSAAGSGFDAPVRSLCVYNNELYAGGDFLLSGSTAVSHLAKWSGSQWQAVGTGTDGNVNVLQSWNGSLYAGGDFVHAGSTTVNHICEWNGSSFAALGTGVSNTMMNPCTVRSLGVYGNALFVGGNFNTAGSVNVRNLARWDGSSWYSIGNVGTGMMSDGVWAMCVYNGMLFTGGNFSACGSSMANNLGMWNGSSWSTIGTGMNGRVEALAVFNNRLYIGGAFTNADGTPASHIAGYDFAAGMGTVPLNAGNFSLYPNPAISYFNFNWTQQDAAPVTLIIKDMQGRLIAVEELGVQGSGEHFRQIRTEGWSNGIYLLSLVCGNEQANMQKIVVTGQ